ncbi:MAG: erythromycin esterase family protein [Chloroflexi bacterium]|nr:erythromycin esterase family protein [Chloroflexota bacterium]
MLIRRSPPQRKEANGPGVQIDLPAHETMDPGGRDVVGASEQADLATGRGAPQEWWLAGSQLREAMENRYAVIGMALGTSELNGIAAP